MKPQINNQKNITNNPTMRFLRLVAFVASSLPMAQDALFFYAFCSLSI
jgi:hypothetical protein